MMSKYHFKNDLAFTEDGIEIYNIYMCEIPKELQRKEAKRYFETFGEIIKFRIKSKTASGYIQFKEAKSAAKALKRFTHDIDESKIVTIKACETWHQPGGNFVNNTKHFSTEKQTEISNDEMTIQILNDDCLFFIFENLVLKDQILFACSHERFKNVFQTYAKRYYKSVVAHMFDKLTLWIIRQFFIFAGHYIEKFSYYDSDLDRKHILNFARVYCLNLLELELSDNKIKLTTLPKFLTKNPKLKTLILKHPELPDYSIHVIEKGLNLENLRITSDEFTGKFLNRLKGLKKLSLVDCSNLEPSHLQKSLIVMPNLRFLDIRLSQLSNQLFKNLPNLVKNLETIKISDSEFVYENVAKIPKLKYLLLWGYNEAPPRSELFHQLVKEKCNQLESLDLIAIKKYFYPSLEHCLLISKLKSLKRLKLYTYYSITDEYLSYLSELNNLEAISLYGCHHITNDGVLDLVRRCTKLKIVDLQHTNVNNKFANNIIKNIKENKRPNGRITFLVGNTYVKKFSLPQEYPEVQEMVFFFFDVISGGFYEMISTDYFEKVLSYIKEKT